VGAYSLPLFVKKLLHQYPRLELSFLHGLSREMLEEVVSSRVDFGLVMNPSRHPDLVIKELCQDQVSFWAGPTVDRATLIFDPALRQAQTLVRKIGSRKSFERHLHSSSLEVIASLAEAGCGVAILPERLARRYSRLSPFDGRMPSVRDRLCLIYRSDRHLTSAAKTIARTIMGMKI
jgi:DNA-binding transcriptional LysR family regulator